MTRWPIGRVLISAVALVTAVTPYLADLTATHIYNPVWPPHAKFHNAQTILMGSLLGIAALAYLWGPARRSPPALRFAAVLASLYWLSQAGAILFPGTAFADPGADPLPQIAGVRLNQVMLSAVFLGIVLIGYRLESRRLVTSSDDSRSFSGT